MFYGPLIKVSPGTKIQGTIKLTSQSINVNSYSSSFKGYLCEGELHINTLSSFNSAIEAIEAYYIVACGDFPPEEKIKMTDIQIKTDSIIPFINWTTINPYLKYGQYANIISNNSFGDEIDLYFHDNCTPKPAPTYKSKPIPETISISPNPTDGLLHASIIQPILYGCRIDIFNSLGSHLQTVLKGGEENEFDIDLRNYPAGFYVIHISYNQKIYTYKIIKE
jgi:hypothetical protein